MSASPTDAPDTLVARVSNLIAENKRALIIATASAVVAGGVGYYYYRSTRQVESTQQPDVEKADKQKKKKSSSKKKKSVKDKDGPILEERKPKVEPKPDSAPGEAPKLTPEEIEALPLEERLSRANAFKVKGNSAYQKHDFAVAVDFYTQAIEISPNPEAVYYSNRAACYVNYTPPQFELVVQDCDEALKRDKQYIKALNRRANALESLDRLPESLRDFTAATILDKFQNEATGAALERVLKKIAQTEAKEIIKTREPRLPSFTFIYAYLAAFRPRSPPTLPESPSQGDSTLLLAFQALDAQDYSHSLVLINEAIEQGISWDTGKAEGFNLRGTFKFLTGDSEGAKSDFQAALDIDPNFTQAWVKIASVHMEMGDPAATFAAFDSAISYNSTDPDIYYHRGQVNFIMQQFKEAEADYNKSTALDPDFVFSHIQLAVAQYKTEQIAASMATFRRTMKAFPQRSEPQNYYGELLLDQQRFQDAVDKFDRAIEIERAKKPMNVLPLVNKALTVYQWQQDVVGAERLLREALQIDPDCDSAVATLAQLTLQQGKLDEAVEMFGKHASIARTEPELEQALTFKYATSAQKQFLKDFPHMAGQLGAMAMAMQGQ